MKTEQKVKGLGGVIFSSPNPDRLAEFYKNVIGIPLALNSHGGLHEHWECDFDDIHFAILPQWEKKAAANSVIPSFVVDDIETFMAAHGLEKLHPIMKLDEGKFVVTLKDIDGNSISLWMDKNLSD